MALTISPDGLRAYEFNGQGGVSYFARTQQSGADNSWQPVTNQNYAYFTGQDTNALEAQAYQQYQASMGTPTGTYGPDNPHQGGTQPAGQTSGGGGTAQTSKIVDFNGQNYDLNNSGDRQAFYQVKSSEIDKNLTQALQTGNLSYAKQLASIQDQMTQYMHDWTAQGETLGAGYNQGITARQQFFQGLGGRAYQSAMGTSGQNALNELGKAQDERNYQKDIQTKASAQSTSGLEQAYNDWQNQAGQTAQQSKDSLSTSVANIGGFNAPTAAPIMGQADLSAYTPYTNFQALSSSPMVTSQKTVNTPVSQMTLSEWLQGQTDKSGNPLSQYLQGKTA